MRRPSEDVLNKNSTRLDDAELLVVLSVADGELPMSERGVIVVHPNRLFRDGLRLLLSDFHFRENADGLALAQLVELDEPIESCDLLILSVGPRDFSDQDLLRVSKLRQEHPSTRVVVLGDALSREDAQRLLSVGVNALLSADVSGEMLRYSLELVLMGHGVFPTESMFWPSAAKGEESAPAIDAPAPMIEQGAVEVASPAVPPPNEPRRKILPMGAARPIPLSEREKQVLACLIKGVSNKAIARSLDISEATVKAHVKALLRKIRASNRTQAAIWALNNRFNGDSGDGGDLPLAS